MQMLCAELEKLEGELDDVITELEREDLSSADRKKLEIKYSELSKLIGQHQRAGHQGGPCFEE